MPSLPRVASSGTPDIDRILEAIRSEARARGSKGRVGGYPQDVAAAAAGVPAPTHGLGMPEPLHASDFLALPLDVFLAQAYERVLGRPADAPGRDHYQRLMLRGALTRMEVLGRLRFSPEGRAHSRPIGGIALGALFATFYRIPLAGPVAGLVARLLRLPAHLQDRSTLEAAALASGGWMKR